ncbi:ABC transporter permease [Ornithinimicrobium avium]|uniref:ABC transporter permease n=1 Tax=Ornithinimicrobium avium TaxID=2283195 RepID=A0A345NKD7_9MICO|nr:ABC transporter permease [Ornithinimicrobium avium]AXH95495.1 ABC transporter permease [Ornithinimicrobium avium]
MSTVTDPRARGAAEADLDQGPGPEPGASDHGRSSRTGRRAGVGTGAAPGPRRPRLPTNAYAVGLLGLLVPTVLVVAWHWASTAGVFAVYQLPPPVSVWEAGVDLWSRGELTHHVAISTQRVLLGFAVGALLGLAVGAVVGLSRWSSLLLAPTVGAFRAVPSLAWVPLLILWLKLGEDSKVTLVAIGAFFPVYTMVAGALRHVDVHLIELGRAYGLRPLRLFTRIQLPAVLPTVVSALRLALAQAWLFLVAAELAGASMGLGFLLTDSQNNGRVDRLVLAIVLLALLGKLTDSVIGLVETRLLRRWM